MPIQARSFCLHKSGHYGLTCIFYLLVLIENMRPGNVAHSSNAAINTFFQDDIDLELSREEQARERGDEDEHDTTYGESQRQRETTRGRSQDFGSSQRDTMVPLVPTVRVNWSAMSKY